MVAGMSGSISAGSTGASQRCPEDVEVRPEDWEMVQNGVPVVRRYINETTCKKTESCKISKKYGGAKIHQESKTRSKMDGFRGIEGQKWEKQDINVV